MRKAILSVLLLCIAALVTLHLKEQYQPTFDSTFSPFFQLLGKPLQTVNRTVTHLFPISQVDEKMLGEEIKAEIATHFPVINSKRETAYLNHLIQELTADVQSGFDYQVFLISGAPNAMALPGGVICFTDELLNILSSEAELIGILGHEIGHIERGHLFDAVRQEMLKRKMEQISLLTYALDAIGHLGKCCFNKTQEDEADTYAFHMLVDRGYDPFSMSSSLEKLLPYGANPNAQTDLIHDFLATHPYLELRVAKFLAQAEKWQVSNPDTPSYVGQRNFKELKTRSQVEYKREFKSIKAL
jgi:predicted Zn-dependent protease